MRSRGATCAPPHQTGTKPVSGPSSTWPPRDETRRHSCTLVGLQGSPAPSEPHTSGHPAGQKGFLHSSGWLPDSPVRGCGQGPRGSLCSALCPGHHSARPSPAAHPCLPSAKVTSAGTLTGSSAPSGARRQRTVCGSPVSSGQVSRVPVLSCAGAVEPETPPGQQVIQPLSRAMWTPRPAGPRCQTPPHRSVGTATPAVLRGPGAGERTF